MNNNNKVLNELLSCLVHLSCSKSDLKGLQIRKENLSEILVSQTIGKSLINCGLAHGIPGILAALSISKINGIQVTKMDDAICRIADWLVTHFSEGEEFLGWPSTISIDSNGNYLESNVYTIPTWCYGAPGIARSLALASKAMDRKEYKQIAVNSIEKISRINISNLDSPIICHGIAGLLLIVLHFLQEELNPSLSILATQLYELLLSFYEPKAVLGFRATKEKMLEDPTLLSGTAGISMTLLSAVSDVHPSWDRSLLIA